MGEMDPDSLVQKHGVDRFLEVLGNAMDIFAFALREWAAGVAQMSGREKSEAVEKFVPLLSAVTDPVVRNDAAQRIADALRLEFEVVWSRVRGRAQAAPAERVAGGTTWNSQRSLLAAALQGLLPPEVLGRLHEGYFEDEACRTIFSITKNDLHAGNPIDFNALSTHLRGEAEVALLSELVLGDLFEPGFLGRVEEALGPLERRYLERRKTHIQREIVEAERAGDESRLADLLTEKARMLNSLK